MLEIDDMCFCVSRNDLMKSLSRMIGVIERRSALISLSGVKIEAKSDKLNGDVVLFTATDLDISVVVMVSSSGTFKPGCVVVSCQMFCDIVRKLPTGSDVLCIIDENKNFGIMCGGVSYSLPFLGDKKDFPDWPEDVFDISFEIGVDEFRDVLLKTKFAMSADDSRYNVSCLHIGCNESGVAFVSTDVHRMSLVNKGLDSLKFSDIASVFSVNVPRKTIFEVFNMLDPSEGSIMISLSSRRISFIYDNCVVVSKLVDCQFPDYESVVPTGNKKLSFSLPCRVLSDAIDRVAVVLSDKVKLIKFCITSASLIISAGSVSSGSAFETIEIRDLDFESRIDIGFNAKYLLDVLSCFDGDCRLTFFSKMSGCLVESASDCCFSHILMPMRV